MRIFSTGVVQLDSAASKHNTQEDIAEAVEVPRQTITDWLNDFAENSMIEESANWQSFDPPIYNVWKQQSKSNTVSHFGFSERSK